MTICAQDLSMKFGYEMASDSSSGIRLENIRLHNLLCLIQGNKKCSCEKITKITNILKSLVLKIMIDNMYHHKLPRVSKLNNLDCAYWLIFCS